MKTTTIGTKPPITLTARDHQRLSRLAQAAERTMSEAASELMEELDRARVLPEGKHPVDAVCMGCEVVYRDDTTARVQTVTLVYPEEADIGKGKVSVLTPIGTALVGLAVGRSINWKTRNGDFKRLTVMEVREPTHTETLPLSSEDTMRQPA